MTSAIASGPTASRTALSSAAPPLVRAAAGAAALWAIGFAGVNLWVQAGAIGSDEFAGSLVGLGVLNLVAIGMKGIGAVVALRAAKPLDGRLVGMYAAVLTTASATLLVWGVLSLGAALLAGGLTDPTSLAGGLIMIPAWLYPAAFGVGALAFAPPARHLMGQAARPRRWTLVGVLLGPAVVVGTIAVTAWAVQAAGLLRLG